jgi:large subunit ribosomal protein L35
MGRIRTNAHKSTALLAMPKMKSHSGAKKRFKKTKSGKIKRKQANKGHLLTKKDQKRKNNLSKDAVVDETDAKRIKRLLSS